MPSTAFAASVAVPVHGLHLCRRVAKRLRGSLERPVTSGCDGAMPLEVVWGGVCGSGSGRSIAAMSAVDGWLGLGGRYRTIAERYRGEKEKLRQASARRSFLFRAEPRSDPLHLRCLRSFLSLDDLELHLIALGQ